MFPIDVVDRLEKQLAGSRRPPDGKLHPSGDLTGSLRHCQLAAAGAPTLEPDLVSEVNLAVGTAIHSLFESLFRGTPTMLEVKLDRWMPEGWSGTADWITWSDEYKAFVLGDLKTQKPGGMGYIERGGAKESHVWQVSAYWHALRASGMPLLDAAYILYLPKGQLLAREGAPVSPLMVQIIPLPEDVVLGRMAARRAEVDAYLASLDPQRPLSIESTDWNTGALAPVQDRDVKLSINKQLKRPVIDVKLAPNWSTEFCPFPTELCDCREQKTNKIGSWDRDDAGLMVYTPSKGFETYFSPTWNGHHPDPNLTAALVKAQKEKSDGSS